MGDLVDSYQAQVTSARRNQILEAAGRVMARKGYHHASVKEIAQEAGIADGTIYNYFENKADLLRGLLARLHQAEGRAAAFAAYADKDLHSFLASYLRRRMTFVWANIELYRALLPELLVNAELQEMYHEQMVRPAMEMAESYLATRVRSGELRPVDEALAARILAASLLGLMTLQFLGDETVAERWQEFPDTLATILVDGLTL